MTRRPFDPDELGQADPELEGVTAELEGYTRLTANETPRDLAERVMAGVAAEPAPRRGVLASLFGPLAGWPHTSAGRAVLVAGTMALAIAAVVFAGQLAELFAPNQVGPSPAPTETQTTVVSPSPSPTLEESVTPSPSPTVAPTTVPTAPPSLAPTPAETPRSETPEPTETARESESETPRPSEDNSGPGGGDDGSS